MISKALRNWKWGISPCRRYLNINSRPQSSVPFEMGQATHETRKHYLPNAGNLTPGISSLEYYQRRLLLGKELPAKSIAILVGKPVKFASGSVFYDFQQDNDLYYMTGWLEPESVAIIEKRSDSGNEDDISLHMLVQPKDPQVELWEGHRSGLHGAYDFFNADYVEDIGKARQYIESLLDRNEYIYWDNRDASSRRTIESSGFSNFFNIKSEKTKLSSFSDVIKNSRKHIRSLSPLITKQRAVKSDAEISVMHAACQISSRAFNMAMAKVGSESPIYTEKTLAKYLEYEFVKGGCDKQAYIPVVASGKNALTIHYTRNDDLLYRDDMVFVDAGGKLGGYCADISRTWPNSPNGFSEPQQEIYEAVLNTNKKCIDLCSESLGLSINDIHTKSVIFLTEELRNLTGFNSLTTQQVARHLYPHYVGHHLGLDLHDVPSESKFKRVDAGNVLTIEPGLYVPFDPQWPKWYHGIGVRVEDDIVVGKTPDDIINLTSGCVKEIKDIESLISSGEVTTPGIDKELVVLDI